MPSKKKVAETVVEPARSKTKFEKRTGISAESLGKILREVPLAPDKKTPLGKLVNLVRSRVIEGRRQGLRDWQSHAAVDEAWDAPYRQITPTIIGKIFSGNQKLTVSDIQSELKTWGLSEDTLFTCVKAMEGDKEVERKILNRETLVKVLIPLVKSVVTVRAAKLFNDRNNNPLFVYQPVHSTEESEVIGDIITELIQKMTDQFGYSVILKEAILHTLKYGKTLMFPAESWYSDEATDENGKDFIEKEGLRYNIPHPTRCAIDQMYRASTINTNTGCEWALYWNLCRYGDVVDNEDYYNTDKISFGTNWFDSGLSGPYFQSIYPCVMELPVPRSEFSGKWNANTREGEATIYTEQMHDRAVFTTELFMYISPKKYGLGDYDKKIWISFKVANDTTIIFAEPYAYNPVKWAGYNVDGGCARNPGMALEAIPFQDLAGNIISQNLTTVKQNQFCAVAYDINQMDEYQIAEIDARAKDSVGLKWLPFDFRKMMLGEGSDPSRIFNPITFPQKDTSQFLTMLNTIISMMERVFQMSPQETGNAASHEQSSNEISVITNNVSNMVAYIGTSIDDFIDAWKKQLYVASREYMDDEFVVQVSGVDPRLKDRLEKDYGFKLGEPFNNKLVIGGSRSKLAVEAFMSSRDNSQRINQPKIAAIILQTMQVVLGNAELVQKVGAEWIVATLNRASKLAGGPDDFKVKIAPEATTLMELKQIHEQIVQAAQQITQGAVQQAKRAVEQEVAPELQKTQQLAVQAAQVNQQQQQDIQALTDVIAKLNAALVAANPPPQRMPVGMDNQPMPPQGMMPQAVPQNMIPPQPGLPPAVMG